VILPDMLQTPACRLFLFILLLACGVLQLRFAYQEQLVFSLPTARLNTAVMRDAHKLTYLAKQKHLFEADLEGAQQLLQRALTISPFYIPTWLALAEIYYDEGETDLAKKVLDYADTLLDGLKRWRWEKTLTAYQLGMTEELPAELRFIIREIPGKNRGDALKLAFTLWKDPQELINNIDPENVLLLFNYAVQKKEPDKALYLWGVVEKTGAQWDQPDILRFLEMLIGNDRIPEATAIWRTYFNPDESLYNGNFSEGFLNTAFGWRKRADKGFVYRFEPSGQQSDGKILHYRFKGWENINFAHLYQVVPLQAGKTYQLSAEFKSDKISTDQRPFLEVSGFKCKAPYNSTEMVRPDQNWTQHKIVFEVPDECSAMMVRLRRKASKQLDNKLSGKLWLRNLAVVEHNQATDGRGKTP
jgi:tetratricopeptide (TPR) repeat protein